VQTALWSLGVTQTYFKHTTTLRLCDHVVDSLDRDLSMFLSYDSYVLTLALFSRLVCVLLLRLSSYVCFNSLLTSVLIKIICVRRERLQLVEIPHKHDLI
jgi:hypothetical protein